MDAQHKLPRLFVPDSDLSTGKNLYLSETQVHYLRHVLRKEIGDCIRVFNGVDGEWLSSIEELSKNKCLIKLNKLLHQQKSVREIVVFASLVKKEALELMIEKAAELGATRFMPLICDRTVVHRANVERLQLIATEAAEQCERLNVMRVAEPEKIKNALETASSHLNLIFCIERKEEQNFEQVARKFTSQPVGIIIGPEGGFTDQEIDFVQKLGNIHSVTLGEAVLRSETALISALAGLQLLS